jgi:hypothetical protein
MNRARTLTRGLQGVPAFTRARLVKSLKLLSIAATIALLAGAVAMGGGHPLSPGRLASLAGKARAHTTTARANTSKAVRDTSALAAISNHVESQVATSRRMLETQREIHDTARRSVANARVLAVAIKSVQTRLSGLERELDRVSGLSARSTGSAEASATSSIRLRRLLNDLEDQFHNVVLQSRKLNRKARAFARIRHGPR